LRRFLLSLVLLPICQVLAGIEDGPRYTAHPDWMETGLVDLETELRTAKEEQKTGVMVFFSTVGCTYCGEFDRVSLGNPRLGKYTQDNFITVGLKIFDDAQMTDHLGNDLPIKQCAEQQKAGMASTLLFFGADRKPIFRAIGYQSPERFRAILDYLIDDHYKQITFHKYLARHQASPKDFTMPMARLRADPLFTKPPYVLSRLRFAAEEPLLVIF
jgi:thioredoxin-related protein